MAQNGAAQMGQAGHLDRSPPEPDVAIPSSVTRRHELVTDGGRGFGWDQIRVTNCN